ncbi:MAG: hypothetical protein GX649_19675, partial [Chloroflexi bacterium]|nr:hypothetical protein [Chloroflexota bacterium]
MEALSREYDGSREDVQTDDLTVLVIRALGRCAAGDEGECVVTTSQVTDAVEALAREDEQDLGWMPDRDGRVRRVGHKLSSLRLKRVSRPGGKGGRRWAIGWGDLARLLRAYGLPVPEGVSLRMNGPNGTMAQPTSPADGGGDA